MPNVNLEFPKVIATENLSEKGAFNLKNVPSLVQKILDLAMNGVVTKDGKWGVSDKGVVYTPGPDWSVEKTNIGEYKVSHQVGYKNTSLSVSILQSPGTINIKESNPLYFVVETSIDQQLTDMPFAFSLVKVISPPA